MQKSCAVALLLLAVFGCTVRKPVQDRSDVSAALLERTGHGTTPTAQPLEGPFPTGVNPDDGLSEDEAVAVALWNNPGFQANLAELGFAHAELIQAGMLRNPVLSLLFPVGPKQLEAAIAWPVEALWKRPRRVSMANLNAERVAEGLVQNGLDLAMSVKIAYADLLLARDRARLSGEWARLQREIGGLNEARGRAGEISDIEVDEVRATALEAELAARRLAHEVDVVRTRLLVLLGIADELIDLRIEDADRATPPALSADLPQLLESAFAARPDLRAAELAIEAAGERAGLARSKSLSIVAVVDANEEGEDGFEAGPGIGLAIPLFDRGQGERALAAAELERATHEYSEVRNRIAAEVREASARFSDAREALEYHRNEIVRVRDDTVRRTEKAHEAGELSYLDVLATRVRHIDALLQQAQVSAELHQARARLENAVGSDPDRPPGRIARLP